MPTTAKPVFQKKNTAAIALAVLGLITCFPDSLPANAAGGSTIHLVCMLKGPAPARDFATRICKRMATAFQAKLQQSTLTRLLASGKSGPSDTIIALTITVKGPSVLSAVAKSGTTAQWRAGKNRTSLPIDVTVSDARLNQAAIENLAQSARFLFP